MHAAAARNEAGGQGATMSAGDSPQFVVMGRIAASFGVKGWFKVLPLSSDPLALIDHRRWFFRTAEAAGEWAAREIDDVREHSGMLVAKIAGIDSPEAAQVLRGQQVALPRDSLPAPAEDEIYVADLVGLRVVNRAGIELGDVQEVQETGAHPLLRVVAVDARERLIPYVDVMIDGLDRDARTLSVDWDAAW
ncbi:MAG: ribosome maturation factor RimM [Betaproteobacteria bacterium]